MRPKFNDIDYTKGAAPQCACAAPKEDDLWHTPEKIDVKPL